MDKLKFQIHVQELSCGHKAGVKATMNPETGAWNGSCSECGAPAKVEMRVESPSGMKPLSRKYFPVGSRVIVGKEKDSGTVLAVSNHPGSLGEYIHDVQIHGSTELRIAVGSEMEDAPRE